MNNGLNSPGGALIVIFFLLIVVGVFRFLVALFFTRGVAKRIDIEGITKLVFFFFAWFLTELAFLVWVSSFFLGSKKSREA